MPERQKVDFGYVSARECEIDKLTVNGTVVTSGRITSDDGLTVSAGDFTSLVGVTAAAGNIQATRGNITAVAGNIQATAGTIQAGGNISSTGGNIVASAGGISAATFAHITPLSAAAINALSSTPDGTIVIWRNGSTLVPLYRSGSNWKKLKDDANQTVS